MGNCLQSVINVYLRKKLNKKNIILLMTGLDNAGKTSVLNCIVKDLDENVASTMGFRVVPLKHKLYSVKVYDVGGAHQIRSLWKKYYKDIHGLIYVVDASDDSRLNENKLIFGELISHEHVAGKPILLLANKQDLTGAIDELDLVEHLDVESAVNLMQCPTRVETSCALNHKYFKENIKGIIYGYRWLLEAIMKNYTLLEDRINTSHALSPVNYCSSHSIRSSISMNSSQIACIHSTPFKPIGELVSLTQNNHTIKYKSVQNKEGSKMRKLLIRNKTAPISEGLQIINSERMEHFKENENSDEIAFIALDPLNLLSQEIKAKSKSTRPFTAPIFTQNPNAYSTPNIPGQVSS